MQYIPFDALLTEPVDISIHPNQYAKNFPFLGKQININHGYSATLMLQQSDIKLKEFDKELLALDPVFDQKTIPSDTVLDFITDNSSESYKGQVNIESLDGTSSRVGRPLGFDRFKIRLVLKCDQRQNHCSSARRCV